MARLAMVVKQQQEPKYKSRKYNRCEICGRPRAYFRDFHICRLCLRKLASQGKIPGMRKASW